MTVNRKVTGTAWSMPAGLSFGILFGIVVTVIGAIITGILVSKEIVHQSSIGYCSMALILLSSICASGIAIRKIKKRRVYVCCASGLIYYCVLLGINGIFFGGHYKGMGATALLVLGGCTLIALMGLRGDTRTHYRPKRYTNR